MYRIENTWLHPLLRRAGATNALDQLTHTMRLIIGGHFLINRWKSPFSIDFKCRPCNSIHNNVKHCDKSIVPIGWDDNEASCVDANSVGHVELLKFVFFSTFNRHYGRTLHLRTKFRANRIGHTIRFWSYTGSQNVLYQYGVCPPY